MGLGGAPPACWDALDPDCCVSDVTEDCLGIAAGLFGFVDGALSLDFPIGPNGEDSLGFGITEAAADFGSDDFSIGEMGGLAIPPETLRVVSVVLSASAGGVGDLEIGPSGAGDLRLPCLEADACFSGIWVLEMDPRRFSMGANGDCDLSSGDVFVLIGAKGAGA